MVPLDDHPTFRGSASDLATRLLVAGAGISSWHTLPPNGEILIGRHAQSQVVIPDTSVSRRHALLKVLGIGTFTIEDLGSANGTSVNNQSLEKGKAVPLRAGDVVRVGDVAILVRGPQLKAPARKDSEAQPVILAERMKAL